MFCIQVGENDAEEPVFHWGKAVDKCLHCGKVGKRMKVCGRCYSSSYCGMDCSTAAWPAHRLGCKKMCGHMDDMLQALRAHGMLV